MIEIIVQCESIIKIILISGFPDPVIGRKPAEQEVESLGVSHRLMLPFNCKRRKAIGDRRLVYLLQFISIYQLISIFLTK